MHSPDNINHPRFEGQAVLALELSTRVLLANRTRPAALWPLFHNYAEKVIRGGAGAKETDWSFASKVPFLAERVMVNTIRTCIHLLDRDTLRPMLFQSLALFTHLSHGFITHTSSRLTSGLLLLIHANAPFIGTNSIDWSIFFDLLEMALPFQNTWQILWETINLVLDKRILNESNIDRCYSLLLWFVNGRFDPLERSTEQIPVELPEELIEQGLLGLLKFNLILFGQEHHHYEALDSRLPVFEEVDMRSDPPPLESSWSFSAGVESPAGAGNEGGESLTGFNLDANVVGSTEGQVQANVSSGVSTPLTRRNSAYSDVERTPPEEIRESEVFAMIQDQPKAEAMWVDTLQTLKLFMNHPCDKISRTAADCLQRLTLLSGQIASLGSWQICMKDVLLQLPIVLSTKQPTIGMGIVTSSSEEVCLRCSTLLSRTFLNNLQVWIQLEDFHMIWLKMIGLLGYNVKHSAPGSVMHESTLQIITNMVMVIDHARIFEKSHVINYQQFVDSTWNILDSTSPSLRRSLMTLAPNLMSPPQNNTPTEESNEDCPESKVEAFLKVK